MLIDFGIDSFRSRANLRVFHMMRQLGFASSGARVLFW